MNSDHWYYIDGNQTCGPVPESKIAEMIDLGFLNPAAQVAPVGWPTWMTVSEALPMLGRAPVVQHEEQQALTPVVHVAVLPADRAMAEIAAISGRVSQIPGPLITRGLKRGGVILGALVLAFAVGLAAKKIADLNLRDENQTPQAEE